MSGTSELNPHHISYVYHLCNVVMRSQSKKWRCVNRLVEEPWWRPALGGERLEWWLASVDARALAAQPLRRRLGLMHAIEDLLKQLGHCLKVRTAPPSPAPRRPLANISRGSVTKRWFPVDVK